MGTQSEIQDYLRRPRRYSNIDGSGDMFFGVMCLSFALLSYLQSMFPADSIWTGKNWHQLVFMPLLLAVLGLGWWATKAVKRHLTYPRTGYVALSNTWRARLLMLIGGSVSTALTFAVFYWLRHSAVSLRHMGVLILYEAAYVGFVAVVSRDHPWKWFVAPFMALGLAAIEFAPPGSVLDQPRSVMLFLGLTWLASGGITLYLYIRRTLPPDQAAE